MDKRLHSRLTNPPNYIMPTYRINNDWKREEARIISEQAQKDALQEQATQEAARAIAKLERQEAERNPWIAAAKMTAIQGVNRANNLQTRSNEEENNIESWANAMPTRMNTTQPSDAYIDDSTHNSWVESSNNATNVNNLIGSWRNGYRVPTIDIGNSNQFARLSGGYGEAGSAADVLTGEGSYMMNLAQNRGNYQYDSDTTTAPLVGIDNIEGYMTYIENEMEKSSADIERILNGIKQMGEEIGLSIAMQTAEAWLKKKIPTEIQGSKGELMLEITICRALVEGNMEWQEAVKAYMQKNQCSREEAESNPLLLETFLLQYMQVSFGYLLNYILQTFNIKGVLALVIQGIIMWLLSKA